MGVVITPESELGKELAKWEKKNYNPDAPENQYPRMLYMAQERPDGIVSVGEVSDRLCSEPGAGIQDGAAANFTKRCQRIVKNENEERVALEQGWRRTQQEARDRIEDKKRIIADAAAHRAYEDRNMSDKAKAEVAAVEAATEQHVAEVPEAPRVKRKYTRRAAATA